MAARLMIVEDDDRVRAAIRLALEDEGYVVDEAADAETALEALHHTVPDVMIVDLMLGEMDGFSCIREIRHKRDVPIIVVSARDDTHDVVAALEVGADDYVTKPFETRELTARIRALRRRVSSAQTGESPSNDVVLLPDPTGPLVLSPEAGVLRRGDEPIHLTVTEFRVLCELADPPGRVLSRAALLDRVWDHGFFGDERIVDVHIRRLRAKIEADPSDPVLVTTVRGLGYRLDVG